MAGSRAKERILDVAEDLFARRGLTGVSLRAINAAAGLSAAALHYHFRSKEELVTAILMRHMDDLMGRRRTLLDALEASGDPPTVREAVDVLVVPLAELMVNHGVSGRRYVRFLARLFADRSLDITAVWKRFPDTTERFEPIVQRALPHLSVQIVKVRLTLALESVLGALADYDPTALIGPLREKPLPLPDFVTAVVDFVSGGLSAPSHVAETATVLGVANGDNQQERA